MSSKSGAAGEILFFESEKRHEIRPLFHSGNNMSSKSGAAGEILFFESEKRHEI